MKHAYASSAWSPVILKRAAFVAFLRLDPRDLWRNPVIFLTEAGALLTTLFFVRDIARGAPEGTLQTGLIAFWLWATVLFATFSEALAEGRGRAQAESLRAARQSARAVLLGAAWRTADGGDPALGPHEIVDAARLEPGDEVLVDAGESIPADGEVVHGAAMIDESAVTGESAPVIREAGGDRSAVTGGTRVLSDRIVVRVTAAQGSGFIDRMIAMVEGARRQKTPNEIGLSILLAAFTIVFLAVSATLLPLTIFAATSAGAGAPVAVPVLVALFVCLAPTTIGGLLPAIGIAGMDRLLRRNVVAMSGRAVEAAGDVDVLLLDKTGTITLGNRQAVAFLPAPGVGERDLADAAQLASIEDETPEGRSIVVLAKQRFGLRAHADDSALAPHAMTLVRFSAQTRMSGVDLPGRRIRKGAVDAMKLWCAAQGRAMPPAIDAAVNEIARSGGTPLVVADDTQPLGVVHLKDIVKGGIKERFEVLRRSGIKTVMITGDNPVTAGAIAAEAGVDEFLAEATPEAKLVLIREHQTQGRMVAMMGDGTNDAPALAQADVAVAMNTGTQPAREAANMIDLDSDPTKLLEIVEVGKQLLMTRGALTTFSISNDVAKYFAIIPAAFVGIYPGLAGLNVLGLSYPILSAVIFNALVILALVPLALRGVKHRPQAALALLRRNLLIYGLGGLLAPFAGIKLLDLAITALA